MNKTFNIHGSDGSVLTIEATNLLLDRVCKDYMLESHDDITSDHVKNYVLSGLLRAREGEAEDAEHELA